ncbi:hemogen [Tenrec ecaudatus]|uniref:hemogen n=1 Tax=Tenrec ecaudatus TaxID=94439 RepID=UPI003F59C6A0
MDLRKSKGHVQLHQAPDSHQENHAPDVIGTRSLRNREQLRKRKAETQEKQTSQWLFGEQKKGKRQRTGKGNERRRKSQQSAELKVKPLPQIEKTATVEALAPPEQEMEPPGDEIKAGPPGTSQENAICQEGIGHPENCSEYQETGAQEHPSETCQAMTEPEALTPKMCQETAVFQDHPSQVSQDMAEPEDLSPKTCQEKALLEDHPSRMYQDPKQLSTQPFLLRQKLQLAWMDALLEYTPH